MDHDLRERVIAYRTTMSMVKGMLLDGVITEEEYRKIDTIMTNRYGLSSCTMHCCFSCP